MSGLPRGEFNMPPGVRTADIPGNEPELYRCTDCGWIGDYEEVEHLRAGEDDILDQCPQCESVESMTLHEGAAP